MKLNIGGGKTVIPDFINVDRMHGLEAYPLDYPDESADEIRASHILEHFPYEQTQAVIDDWVRVLKPGGSIKIAVPDFDKIVQFYADQEEVPLEAYLMGGHTNADDGHKAIFNVRKLGMLMEMAGLVSVREWKSDIKDCAALPVSLNLVGDKMATSETVAWGVAPDGPPPEAPPAPPAKLPSAPVHVIPVLRPDAPPPAAPAPGEPHRNVPCPGPMPPIGPPPTVASSDALKVIAVMSVPRLAFQDNMFCMMEAALANQLPLKKFSGAFWGQCLERSIIAAIEDGADAVLAVDYDTVFPRAAVGQLIATMQRHPEADAIAALQANRRTGYPLLSVDVKHGDVDVGANTLEVPFSLFAPELTALTTAHFGLTLIRTAALAKMEHPWFLGVPNEEGRWEENRVDDDIYFWNKWVACGNSLHSANRIVVAHAELMLLWPGEKFGIVHQHPSDFHEFGVPKGVWA